jgi:hypothetical protein
MERKPVKRSYIKRKPPKRRKVKTERQLAIIQADELWKKAVKDRDNWTCQRCGKSEGAIIQAHHIFKRNAYNVRWAMVNGVSLCKGCHFTLHMNSDLRYPFEVKHLGGQEAYDRLQVMARIKKGAGADPKMAIIELKAIIKERG